MEVAFFLHLYQPLTQEISVFKEIVSSCYIPLIKLIKRKKNFKVTLNMPLSLLTQLEELGFDSLLKEIQILHASERLELVGTGAYHPLLTRLPSTRVEQQIILQEYGLGYYFGSRSGFEGEEAIMLKDVNGFFPPEMAVNDTLLSILNSLGYKWVLVDRVSVENDSGMSCYYELPNMATKVLCRERTLSNLLAFKRDDDTDEFISAIDEIPSSYAIVALDGETFGHHNKRGISLLDNLIDDLSQKGHTFSTISETCKYLQPATIDSIVESTWGASDEDMSSGNVYSMWDISSNKIHKLQWKILSKLFDAFPTVDIKPSPSYGNIAIWSDSALDILEDEEMKEQVKRELKFAQLLSSDQFWWSSGKRLPNNVTLFNPSFVLKYNKIILNFVKTYGSTELNAYVQNKIIEMEKELKNAENS